MKKNVFFLMKAVFFKRLSLVLLLILDIITLSILTG